MTILRKPWARQPQAQVAVNPRFSFRLRSLIIPSLGTQDLVASGSWQPFGTTPRTTYQRVGAAIDTTLAAGGMQSTASTYTASSDHTIMLVASTNSASGAYAGLVSLVSTSGDTAYLAIQDAGYGEAYSVFGGGGSFSAPFSAPYTGFVFPLSVFFLVSDADASYATVNNVEVARYAFSIPSVSSSKLVLFGERSAIAAYSTQGNAYLCAHWSRILSATERAELTKNPWSLCSPLRLPIAAASAAIIPPALLAASAVNIGTTYATPRVTFTRP